MATGSGGRPRLRVVADINFSVQAPGHEEIHGTLTGAGDELEIRLSNNVMFAGGRDSGSIRALAAGLAAQGLRVAVKADDVVLVEMGATDSSWWDRLVTRSPHLKVGSARGALTSLAGKVRGAGSPAMLPGSQLVPPTTLFPLAPTFGRRPRPVTTTHDPRRGGNPRLVVSRTGNLDVEATVTFPLRAEQTTIGGDPGADICLAGLPSRQAVVVHDEHDELVVHDLSSDHSTRVHGARIPGGAVLRTGARITAGDWTLVYTRAEYADHGRPYGGRVGGEAGRQRTQPDPRVTSTSRRNR